LGKIVTVTELADQIPGGVALGIGGVHFSRVPVALIEALLSSGQADFTFVS
jgi:acyl CoA:acetate/3-ketoacid CoA transferase alpha subunit